MQYFFINWPILLGVFFNFIFIAGFHRFKGLEINFDGVKVYTYQNEPKLSESSFHADFCQSRRVRVVKLTKSNIARGDSVPRIQICEVQVYCKLTAKFAMYFSFEIQPHPPPHTHAHIHSFFLLKLYCMWIRLLLILSLQIGFVSFLKTLS